jgi:uncharacterized membrane protein
MAKDAKAGPVREAVGELPLDRLAQEGRNLLRALAERALTSMAGKAGSMTGKLVENIGGGGKLGLLKLVTGGKGPGALLGSLAKGLLRRAGSALMKAVGLGGGKGAKLKITNVVEMIDVGAPIRVVYDQWTQFEDFPSFMKKVESVQQESDEKLDWKAQIFLSHRTWKSNILEQVPDDRIIWRSEGAKGYVDGATSFHELAPNLTRVVLVLEYHPKGMFEHVGNIWRAQGRRARLELKHFDRHVMTTTMLHPQDLEGWRGEIHEGEVTKDDESARREEQEPEEQGQLQDAESGRSGRSGEAGEYGEPERAVGAAEGEREDAGEAERAGDRADGGAGTGRG